MPYGKSYSIRYKKYAEKGEFPQYQAQNQENITLEEDVETPEDDEAQDTGISIADYFQVLCIDAEADGSGGNTNTPGGVQTGDEAHIALWLLLAAAALLCLLLLCKKPLHRRKK